jgi:hypothetical protein
LVQVRQTPGSPERRNSDPNTDNAAQGRLTVEAEFQKQALQTRLKLPLRYGIDAVYGYNNRDAVAK